MFEILDYPVLKYLPSRKKEGYGISKKGLDRIKMQNVDLIITADCGITAIEEVEYAKILGMDVIISDHHIPKNTIPNAIAVIDAEQDDCNYPFDKLCGAAISFKIAQGMIPNILNHERISEFINLVAFASVADIVPMMDENRIFGALGISNMGNSINLGLKALMQVADIKNNKVTSGDLGYKISPMANSAGRLGSPDIVVDLLMSTDKMEADKIAQMLFEMNEERKLVERDITQQCIDIVENDSSYKDDKVLILSGAGWQTGIIGVVASKVGEKYHKPIFILSEGEDGIAKGSGRSISGFDLLESLAINK